MGIYIVYILLTLIAYYAIIGSSRVFRLESGVIVQRNRRAFSWFAGILLWSILALRDVSVGSDTINYFERYANIQCPEFSLLSVAGQEWGYDMLQYFCRSIGLSWQTYLAVVSAIIVVPMAIFFHKYSVNVWASFFLYITIGLLGVNMSAIRQSLAVAMVIIAMMEMLNKKYVKFVLFILISSLFHTSALFALLFALIPCVKYKSQIQLTLLLLIPVLARVVGFYFFGSLESFMPVRYLDSFNSEEQIMNPLLEAVWISILLFAYFSLRINGDVQNDEFKFYFMAVLFVTSIELSYSVYLAGRLAYYFELAIMVVIPNDIMKFRRKRIRSMLSICVYLVCLAFFIVSSFGSDTLVIFSYKFFWH